MRRLVAMAFGRTDWSHPDAQGCQMIEGQVRLQGWNRTRRVVIVRQRVRGGIALTRCQTMARACALVYNWWSWYCRAAHPGARMEAITSRPFLLAAVGKAVNHANQTTLYLTPLHGKAKVLRTLIANIGAAFQHVRQAAEQFTLADRWTLLLRYISERIAPAFGPFRPPPVLSASG